MIRPETELFRGINKENPDVSPTSEEIPYSEISEIDEDKVIFHSETLEHQEILPSQPEIQVEEERRLEQPLTQKREPLRSLLKKKIIEKWRKREITEEEREKSFAALKLWPVHGIICTAGALAIAFSFGSHLLRTGSFTSLLWRMRSDPLFAGYSLISGVAKLGAIFAYEKRYGVRFSLLSKGISLWPFVGGGSAMPIEIVYTLGEGPWLVNEIKERYLKTPLTYVRNAAQKIRGFF